MAVSNVWLVLGIASGNHDGSSDALELGIQTSSAGYVELDSGSKTRTARWGSKDDAGDAAIWQWSSDTWSGSFTLDDVTSVDLELEGDDKMLPSNVFVVMQEGSTYALKGANGAWPADDCFSTDSSECPAYQYTLYSSGSSD